MTVRSKITLLYLATYGSIIVALSITLFLIFRALEFRRIDGLLNSFHRDIVNTYRYSGDGPDRLLSLAGDESLGFAVYIDNRPIASFRVDPDVFSDVSDSGSIRGYRYCLTLEEIDDARVKFVSFYGTEATEEHLRAVFIVILLAAAAMLSIVSLLGANFTMRLIRPIEDAGDQLERISASQLRGGRIRIKHTGREVEKLESEINRALERIEELIDDTRKMSSKIAHELRTPLAIMKTGLQLSLERNSSEQGMKNTLRETLLELDKMIRMSEGFLLLSRLESVAPLEFARLDLSRMLLETVEKMMSIHPKVYFELEAAPGLEITGVGYMLEHVLLNLLDNAARYTSDERVGIRLVDRGDEMLLKTVNESSKAFVGESENQTKSNGPEGHGIGLTVIRSVLQIHASKLDFEYLDGKNIFRVTLSKARRT